MTEPETTQSVLTDEVRALIGVRSQPRTAATPISAEALRRFLHGAMDDNPVYWDPGSAGESKYGGVVAPPLYPQHAFRRPVGAGDAFDVLADDEDEDGTFSASSDLFGLPPVPLPFSRRLNGGTEADFYQLARIGDVITAQSEYVDIVERRDRNGNPMVIIRIKTTYSNQDGAALAAITIALIAR